MAIIEPLRSNIDNATGGKRYSASIRLWHWINAIIITGALLTVLISATLLNAHDNGTFIKSTLDGTGATVSMQQAKGLAHDLEDKVWGIHIILGYFLAASFVFRLLLEVFQRGNEKFISKFKKAYQSCFNKKQDIKTARHQLVVNSLYLIFYILLTIMVLTGLTLAFDDTLGISRSFRHSIKEVHGFCMYLVIGFIAVHIIGVIMAERKNSKGIVSDMINGGNN